MSDERESRENRETSSSINRRVAQATFEERTTSTLDGLCERLERVEGKVDDLRTGQIPTIKTDIALLKFQAGLWGAALGSITAAIIAYFKK